MSLTFARTGHRFGPYMFGQNPAAYYDPTAGSVNGSRILYHSALDGLVARQIIYPFLPDETVFFTLDVKADRDLATAKTLRSNVFAKFPQVTDDTIIKEIFRPEGGLAVTWGFIHRVEQMWLNDPDWDAGEYIIWRPFDRTHKAYAVDILKIMIESEEWKPEYRGRTDYILSQVSCVDESANDAEHLRIVKSYERWTINQFEIHYRVRAEAMPQGTLVSIGGSDTQEAGFFNINEV